ncbi:MAG TPA: LuxR C-terminal-related transcriptional regulator [Nocardioidaceae bacterium]|jgi:DNA-binding CsgD family transcriptional regulator/Tfp pilus assembly protein PilF
MERESAGQVLTRGEAALAAGQWSDAKEAFDAAIATGESAQAWLGLAEAAWWLGAPQASVDACTRAYRLFRQDSDAAGAVRCAVWLAITYKANFGNVVAANGWLSRADRLLEALEVGPLHAWVLIARAYRNTDLPTAKELTARAVQIARDCGNIDAEIVGLSQLGLIEVSAGDPAGGFALIDEAMTAALSGEVSELDTVVYVCCDMLNACDVDADEDRAAKWCRVADDFIATYGCPFLYGECRTLYGGLLVATGGWQQAEQELDAALRITADTAPEVRRRALTRLARLRIRQGRLDEAEQVLSDLDRRLVDDAEFALARAALRLASGDDAGVCRLLEQRLDRWSRHRARLAEALELLVPAQLAAGDQAGAAGSADRLAALVVDGRSDRVEAAAETAAGMVAAAGGDASKAATLLETAVTKWAVLGLPFEAASCLLELAKVWAAQSPERAGDHARRALVTFEELGAGQLRNEAARFLRSIGCSVPPGPRSAGALTKRELEVLELVAAGLSNPEIARRLYVSSRTVSHHVSNILTKLQLRNRAEAAAYAQRTVQSGPAG